MRALLATALVLTLGLSGCFGFNPNTGGFDFVPGEGWEPTGKTVDLKATVVDWTMHEVYPGFHANMWAFCFIPTKAGDQYSADAIDYWNTLESDGANARNPDGSAAFAPQWDGNCSVPGPTLRVQQGDTVRIEFSHDHFHCHTIHMHGQHVPWLSDGAPGVNQDSVCRGDEPFVYEFVAARAGSLWYHCHVDVHFHVMQGLFGAIIVEPQDDRWEPEDVDREYVMVFGSLVRELVQVTQAVIDNPHAQHQHEGCGASGTQGCKNPPVDTHPDTWTLNGRSLPNTLMDDKSVIRVNEGETIRLRLYNVGETWEAIHLHGHDMQITHIDGNPLHPNARYWVDTYNLAPATRADFVFEANNPGLWPFHTHVDNHVSNDFQAPGGPFTVIAYEDIEEEYGSLRPFAGVEMVGGMPWIEPLAIPGDAYTFDAGRVGGVATNQENVNEVHNFAVPLPCATRIISVEVDHKPRFTGLPGEVNNLKARITTPDGAVLIDEAIPAEGFRFTYDKVVPDSSDDDDPLLPKITPGQWELLVYGTAVDSDVVLSTIVDHFEEETQVQYENANRNVSGTECDPNNRVFDPVEYLAQSG